MSDMNDAIDAIFSYNVRQQRVLARDAINQYMTSDTHDKLNLDPTRVATIRQTISRTVGMCDAVTYNRVMGCINSLCNNLKISTYVYDSGLIATDISEDSVSFSVTVNDTITISAVSPSASSRTYSGEHLAEHTYIKNIPLTSLYTPKVRGFVNGIVYQYTGVDRYSFLMNPVIDTEDDVDIYIDCDLADAYTACS